MFIVDIVFMSMYCMYTLCTISLINYVMFIVDIVFMSMYCMYTLCTISLINYVR